MAAVFLFIAPLYTRSKQSEPSGRSALCVPRTFPDAFIQSRTGKRHKKHANCVRRCVRVIEVFLLTCSTSNFPRILQVGSNLRDQCRTETSVLNPSRFRRSLPFQNPHLPRAFPVCLIFVLPRRRLPISRTMSATDFLWGLGKGRKCGLREDTLFSRTKS